MNETQVAELRDAGLTTTAPDGQEHVKVTLQVQQPLADPTREQRRSHLSAIFSQIATERADHLTVDPESLSVSGQLVDATVACDAFDHVVPDLAKEGVRVDIARPEQFT